jgi:hypothetical protein
MAPNILRLSDRLSDYASQSPCLQKHSAVWDKCGCYGYNHYRNDETSEHAETSVVSSFIDRLQRKGNQHKIRRKLKKGKLVVIRLNNDSSKPNMFRNSMPCATCIARLKLWGVKEDYLFNRPRHIYIQENKSTWRG